MGILTGLSCCKGCWRPIKCNRYIIVALLLALVLMYIVLSSRYAAVSYNHHEPGCSETTYTFAINKSAISSFNKDIYLWLFGQPIFGDIQLRTKCKDNETNLPLFLQDSHKLMSKCGDELPLKLLSFRGNDTKKPFDHLIVPNNVYYVSLGRWEFSFLNYLSFKSASVHLKPNAIYIHGDALPFGEWWNRMLSDVADVYYATRERPVMVQGKEVGWLEHSSDILRIQTLLDNGGIYLDTDIIVLKSFDPLRRYAVTLGRETSYGLGSGIILSRPRSQFLCVWMHSFRNYSPRPWNWAKYAVWTPNKLAQELPEQIHIEDKHLQYPTWLQSRLLFDDVYNWSNNYALHIWKRYGNVPTDPNQIKTLNSTLGEVMRFIYYGSKRLIFEDGHLAVDNSGQFGTHLSLGNSVDLFGHRILEFVGFNT